MHRQDWTPSNSSVICSDHFLEKFINRNVQMPRLKEDAEPTRFKAFPKYLKKVQILLKILSTLTYYLVSNSWQVTHTFLS